MAENDPTPMDTGTSEIQYVDGVPGRVTIYVLDYLELFVGFYFMN